MDVSPPKKKAHIWKVAQCDCHQEVANYDHSEISVHTY